MVSDKVKPLKSLGQNFLNQPNTCKRIVDESRIHGKYVLEIGPGTGALTKYITLEQPKKLILIEPDERCIDILKNITSNIDCTIYNMDALKVNFEDILDNNQFHVISNLPYYISSEILIKLIRNSRFFPTLNLMFQKEVCERIISEHSNSEYGRLSVIAQAFYDSEIYLNVDRNQFTPVPNVDSAVVIFNRKPNVDNIDINKLEFLTHEFFMHRRKQIGKVIKKLNLEPNQISQIGVSTHMRAENISVETFIKLIDILK